ncbi:MAG: efflux RND transporter periplasmic adaptor subunit [Flavobacteriaceae bacterium]|jgi:RND family efflux transporter MFP subunit|nr:efflux RND transporter periplasmic adaptor subunit [Flavobacteriaceae bacterium]
MVKKIITGIVVVGLIGLAIWKVADNKKKSQAETAIVAAENEAVAVNVASAKYENINTEYTANGTFEPLQQLNFTSETSGKIIQVFVDEGSFVRVGQVLATVRADQRNINVSTAQAAYQQALADNQRYENAYKTGGVTQQQLDNSRLQLKNAKAQLDLQHINLGDSQIRATINGVINERKIEPGSYVALGTSMFDIVNVSTLKLRVMVDESHVANLVLGQEIAVKSNVFPDQKFGGKITFIAPIADASLNFPVEIQIENTSDRKLKAGMYGTAVFTAASGASTQNILVIPRSAFVGGVQNNQVFVVNGDAAKLTNIVSGRNFGEKIEVLSGLKNGEIVVTGGQINLTDGAKIKVIK